MNKKDSVQLFWVLVRLTATAPGYRIPFHANAERVEGIRTVRSGFQAILLGLSQFLTRFVLLTITDTCRLYGDEQVRVVVTVDEHLMPGTALEHAVDEFVLFDMVPWLADVLFTDCPAVPAEHTLDDLGETLPLGRSVFLTKESGIIVEYDAMGAVVIVVSHEVLAQFLQFAVVLDEE